MGMRLGLALALLVALAAGAAAGEPIRVTVYNEDLALVKDYRAMELDAGVVQVSVSDVSARIDPTSVHVGGGAFQVLEQNFEYDLVSQARLLERYLGQTIEVVLTDGTTERGVLLDPRMTDRRLVLQVDDGILIAPFDQIRLPELPDGLILRPTLRWDLYVPEAWRGDFEISYLTKGLSWRADYVGILGENDVLDLSAWVTVQNQSGATYANALLKLVAGDVNIVREVVAPEVMLRSAMVMEDAAFAERELFEYHIYELSRPTTLLDRQIKQIGLMDVSGVEAQREYVFGPYVADGRVPVTLAFTNSQAEGLGRPLPKGRVRIYQSDADGSLEFIGEDRLDHTARDEVVRLRLGQAFDVLAMRTLVSRTGPRTAQREVRQTEVRNRKERETVAVTVQEHVWGDWSVLSASHTYEKTDAHTLEFVVSVPPGEVVVIEYEVLIQQR